MRFKRDQAVFSEGSPAEYLCSLVRGAVRCCRTACNGERNLVGFYLPGEIFGSSLIGFYDVTAEAVLHDTSHFHHT